MRTRLTAPLSHSYTRAPLAPHALLPNDSDILHSYLKADHVKYRVFEAGHGVTAEAHVEFNAELEEQFDKVHAGSKQ